MENLGKTAGLGTDLSTFLGGKFFYVSNDFSIRSDKQKLVLCQSFSLSLTNILVSAFHHIPWPLSLNLPANPCSN